MAGTAPSIGGLSGTGNPAALPTTQGDYVQAPTQGNLQQKANMGFAVGGLYDAYKKAQIDEVTGASNLAKASRDRLTQIWEAGANNPAVQNDPKIHKQIAALYKNIGVNPLINNKGQFDWNSMQPVKTLNDMSAPMMAQFRQMQPKDRAAWAKSQNLVVDQATLDAPAEMTPLQIQHFNTELADKLGNIGPGAKKPQSAAGFIQWINSRRNAFEQAGDPGGADRILHDPELAKQFAAGAAEVLDKDRSLIDLRNTKNDVLKGIIVPPEIQARIDRDHAIVTRDATLDDLTKIQTNIAGANLANMPQKFQDAHDAIQKSMAAQDATIAHLNQLVVESKTTGKGSPQAATQAALVEANKNMRAAYQQFVAANNGVSGVPPEVRAQLQAATTAQDAAEKAYKETQTPEYKAAYAAANAAGVTNVHIKPVIQDKPKSAATSGWTFKPSATSKDGRPIGLNADGTAYVDAKGNVVK